jgi:hypothetical protein
VSEIWKSRFSTASLIGFVLLAGADAGWLSSIIQTPRRSVFGFPAIPLDFGVVPMANVLAICLFWLVRGQPARGFLRGFTVGGAIALGAFLAAAMTDPDRIVLSLLRFSEALDAFSPVNWLDNAISFVPRRWLVIGWGVCRAIAFLNVPQLAIAVGCGFLARRMDAIGLAPVGDRIVSSS